MSTASTSFPASRAVRPTAAAEPSIPAKALGNVLTIAGVFCLVVAGIVLFGLGGWEYYRAPLGTRGYLPEHPLLRPSGPVGLTLGVGGVVSMLMTLPYYVRKRWRALARIGTPKQWLEVHIFFGIVGPVLITLHTSFKFNGIVSVAYWLMMTVWASGFVGRYLYVRIPKTIRGVELSFTQVEEQLTRTQQELRATPLPADVQARARRVRARRLAGARPRTRSDRSVLRRASSPRAADAAPPPPPRDGSGRRGDHGGRRLGRRAGDAGATSGAPAAHASPLRALARLPSDRSSYGLFVIVALHVGIALYLGYASLP